MRYAGTRLFADSTLIRKRSPLRAQKLPRLCARGRQSNASVFICEGATAKSHLHTQKLPRLSPMTHLHTQQLTGAHKHVAALEWHLPALNVTISWLTKGMHRSTGTFLFQMITSGGSQQVVAVGMASSSSSKFNFGQLPLTSTFLFNIVPSGGTQIARAAGMGPSSFQFVGRLMYRTVGMAPSSRHYTLGRLTKAPSSSRF